MSSRLTSLERYRFGGNLDTVEVFLVVSVVDHGLDGLVGRIGGNLAVVIGQTAHVHEVLDGKLEHPEVETDAEAAAIFETLHGVVRPLLAFFLVGNAGDVDLVRHVDTVSDERFGKDIGTEEGKIRTPLDLDGDLEVTDLGLKRTEFDIVGIVRVFIERRTFHLVDDTGLDRKTAGDRNLEDHTGMIEAHGLRVEILHIRAGGGKARRDAETLGGCGDRAKKHGRGENQFFHFIRGC